MSRLQESATPSSALFLNLSEASTRVLSQNLDMLHAGQRFWFWLSPQASVPLMITSIERDPGMSALSVEVQSIDRPENALFAVGCGSVDGNGRLNLMAEGLTMKMLQAVAAWVVENGAQYSGLYRLRDLCLRRLQSAERVEAVFEDPELWRSIPKAAAPGTAAHAMERLQELNVGEKVWFWAAHRGPSNRPFLAVSAIETDPEGAQLRVQVREAIRRGGPPQRTIQGIISCKETGLHLVVPPKARSTADRIFAGLRKFLPEMPVIHSGAVTPPPPVLAPPEMTLSAESTLLNALETNQGGWFWLSADSDSSEVTLMMSDDLAQLKERVVVSGLKRSAAVRGRFRRNKRGWITFRTQQSAPDFLERLIAFVSAHQGRWPALRALHGARLIVEDEDGDILERHHNPELWLTIAA